MKNDETQTELKIFFVVFVVWVVDFQRGDYQRIGVFESLRHNPLVDGVTTSKTLNLYHENTIPDALLDFLKKMLHYWTGGDCFTRNDLPIDLRNIVVPFLCQFEQEPFVTSERFSLPVSFGFNVSAGFAEIDAIADDGHLLSG